VSRLVCLVLTLALALLPAGEVRASSSLGNVQVDNSLANGAAVGIVVDARPGSALVKVSNPHKFWTNVVLPASSGGVTFTPASPSRSDPLAGFYALAGVIPPGGDAAWQARFPAADSSQVVVVSPSILISPNAGALTIATILVSMIGGVPKAKAADNILKAAQLLLTVPTITAAIKAIDDQDAYGFAGALYDSIGDHGDRLVIMQAMAQLGITATEQVLKRVLVGWTIFELMQLAYDEISARILGTAQGNVTFMNEPVATPGSPLLVVDDQLDTGNVISRPSRVSLVTPDAKVVASADYEAPSSPNIGNAAAIPPAHVFTAQHAVYFADGHGTVRRLTADGVAQVIASFPLKKRRDGLSNSGGWTSSYDQQEIAFAVRPDGRQLAAVIYTLPNAIVDPNCPADQGPGCIRFTPSTVHVDVYRAWAGGPSWLVHSEEVPNQQFDWSSRYPILVGWDPAGPIGVLERATGAQNGGPWEYNPFGGFPVHLDPLGRPGSRIGGADCLAWTELDNQELLCQPGGYQRPAISLRRPDGSVVWNVPVPSSISFFESLAISPDADRVAFGDFLNTTVVVDRAGGTTVVPQNFRPIIWLNNQTVAGDSIDPQTSNYSGVTLVNIAAPAQLKLLDVHGKVVGTIAAP
jgi:hypothetical protein